MWNIIIQRILYSDWLKGFWAVTEELDFSKTCSFYRKLKDQKYFHIQEKRVDMNGLDFSENPQNLNLGIFLDPPDPLRLFSKSELVVFLYFMIL